MNAKELQRSGVAVFSPEDAADMERPLRTVKSLWSRVESIEATSTSRFGRVYVVNYRDKRKDPVQKALIKLFPRPGSAENEIFVQSLRILQRVPSPAVPHVLVNHRSGRYSYYVCQFVDGQELSDLLDAGGLPPDRARAIILQVARSLRLLHHSGCLHLDLKPSNILLRPDGAAVLFDFGAWVSTSGASKPLLVSTREYVPPEMRGEYIKKPPSKLFDIYSLGVILLELLVGTTEAKAMLHKSEQWRHDALADPDPSGFSGLLKTAARCLSPDPSKRFSSTDEFIDSLPKADPGGFPMIEQAPQTSQYTQFSGFSGELAAQSKYNDMASGGSDWTMSRTERIVPLVVLMAALCLAVVPQASGNRWWGVTVMACLAVIAELFRGMLAKRVTGSWTGSILDHLESSSRKSTSYKSSDTGH